MGVWLMLLWCKLMRSSANNLLLRTFFPLRLLCLIAQNSPLQKFRRARRYAHSKNNIFSYIAPVLLLWNFATFGSETASVLGVPVIRPNKNVIRVRRKCIAP